ncbi:MAG: sporulation protein YunB [Clostridia bacterium]|nr:sporulation protein YunB [Clostridia bacterium]
MKYDKLVGQVNRKMSKRKYVIFITSITIIICLIFVFFNNIVNPVILSTSEIKVRSLTLKAVNSAVAEVVSESVLYNDLINITTNEEGDITMITANSILINKLSKELAKTAQAKLEIMGNGGLNIPIGTFSGMPIFVGRGPDVKIKLIPIGSITCTFDSFFESAGINQTHHRIYVNIDASVSMVLPIENKTVKNRSQVLICESIIIGKVPSTYLHSDNLQDMLDLIP